MSYLWLNTHCAICIRSEHSARVFCSCCVQFGGVFHASLSDDRSIGGVSPESGINHIISIAGRELYIKVAEPSSNQTNGAQLCCSGLIDDADVEVEMRNGDGAGEFIVNGSIHKYAFAARIRFN